MDNHTIFEDKEHWGREFSFNLYPCSIPEDFPSVALHYQKSMEIIYIKKGDGLIQMGDREYHGQAGDLFFLPPGLVHSIRNKELHHMEYENLIFDLELLGSGKADSISGKYILPLAGGSLLPGKYFRPKDPDYMLLKKYIETIELYSESRSYGYEMAISGCLMLLMAYLIETNTEKITQDSKDLIRLKSVLNKIEEDYDKHLTVEDMADYCGLSQSHFMKWFKTMTGDSFVNYLNIRRLSRSAELLKETDLKILAIAQQVGFENLSNYNRQFKKRYGLSPLSYRKCN